MEVPFNVARQLYPRHFATKPYGALGWPMRPGDWLPEIEPMELALENYDPQNYEPAERGMFVGLDPLGALEAKVSRTPLLPPDKRGLYAIRFSPRSTVARGWRREAC